MKKWYNLVSTVWVGLSTHKLRSFLTILGVVIGVASVITLMSIGQGSQESILSNIESMGTKKITIRAGARMFGGVRSAAANTLTMEDAQAIAGQVPDVTMVSSTYSSNLQVVVGGENMNSSVSGVTPEYQEVENLEIASGSFFSEQQYDRSSKVAVIGSNVRETLFGTSDPIGQRIRMGTIIATVIGVLESEGGGFPGMSADDAIYIPLTAMQQAVSQPRTAQGEKVVSSVVLTMTSEEMADQVTEDITSLLRERHRLGPGVDDDFNIMSTQEMAEMMTSTTETLTLLLGAVAAISLLVGGIGVMNIMLVSVLERTREIGIRKALGARDGDIWGQFLMEAALLTFAGGIIGVVVGWGLSLLINYLEIMTTVVRIDVVILAVCVAIGIGLFFGFYPAWNASRLNPIEALRSE
jgi:putative ABC transport system permease protein